MMMPISSMPACGHRLDAVEQHRLVRHRHELLGARVRDRAQARALASREDQSLQRLHPRSSLAARALAWRAALVDAAELAVVPARAAELDELQADAFARLRRHRVARLRR